MVSEDGSLERPVNLKNIYFTIKGDKKEGDLLIKSEGWTFNRSVNRGVQRFVSEIVL